MHGVVLCSMHGVVLCSVRHAHHYSVCCLACDSAVNFVSNALPPGKRIRLLYVGLKKNVLNPSILQVLGGFGQNFLESDSHHGFRFGWIWCRFGFFSALVVSKVSLYLKCTYRIAMCLETSSGQESNVVISDMPLYHMSLYPKFTLYTLVLFSTAEFQHG